MKAGREQNIGEVSLTLLLFAMGRIGKRDVQ